MVSYCETDVHAVVKDILVRVLRPMWLTAKSRILNCPLCQGSVATCLESGCANLLRNISIEKIENQPVFDVVMTKTRGFYIRPPCRGVEGANRGGQIMLYAVHEYQTSRIKLWGTTMLFSFHLFFSPPLFCPTFFKTRSLFLRAEVSRVL